MHTFSLTHSLLPLGVLGLLAAAIMTSSFQGKSIPYANRSVAGVTTNLPSARTGVPEQYASSWQRLKSKSECQIRNNEKRIITFKAQRAKAGRMFRATYDIRLAELERRNIALRNNLVDNQGYKEGERGGQK